MFYTERYKVDQPLIIKGAGAGSEVTTPLIISGLNHLNVLCKTSQYYRTF